jgi:hypothetical protein
MQIQVNVPPGMVPGSMFTAQYSLPAPAPTAVPMTNPTALPTSPTNKAPPPTKEQVASASRTVALFCRLWVALLLVLIILASVSSPFSSTNNGEAITTRRHRFCSTCLSSPTGGEPKNLQEAVSEPYKLPSKSWQVSSQTGYVIADLEALKRVVMVSVMHDSQAPAQTLTVSGSVNPDNSGTWTTLATGPLKASTTKALFDLYTPNVNTFRYLKITLTKTNYQKSIGLNELVVFTGKGDPGDEKM